MLGDQQSKICVLGLPGRVFVAMAVDGDNAVGILCDHCALGIHAEGAYPVTVLGCAVDDLAFV